MNLSEIEERVLEIVQDQSFEDAVLPFINQGIRQIAGSQNLYTLDAEATVTCSTGADSVSLPEDYSHGLYSVKRDGVIVGTPGYYDAFARFERYHPDLTAIGKIVDVAVRGRSLHYTGRENIDLELRYFCLATELSTGGDTPDFLPIHLHESILVNYAASQIFNLIEDGIEDPKTNTKVYHSLYLSGLADLQMYTIDTDQPVYVQDERDP